MSNKVLTVNLFFKFFFRFIFSFVLLFFRHSVGIVFTAIQKREMMEEATVRETLLMILPLILFFFLFPSVTEASQMIAIGKS